MPISSSPRRSRATPLYSSTIAGAPTGTLAIVLARGESLERDGQRQEARNLYERSLRDGSASRASEAAQLLRLIARTWLYDCDHAAATDAATCALTVAQLCGDLGAEGHAVNILAIIEWKEGHLDEARQLYLQAREIAIKAGDKRLAAMTALNLGVVANVRGENDEARAAWESLLADARGGGLADQLLGALCNLGQLDTKGGRTDTADRHLHEAREMSVILGDRSMLVTVDLLIAKLRVRQGDHTGARDVCNRTRAIIAEIGDAREAGGAEHVYGLVARASGDLAAAEDHWLRAESIAVARHDMILEGETARELADLYRTQGRNRQTLQRLNQAHRLFAQLRARREMDDVDRRTATLENDFLEVVRKWGDSIESKDMYTQGHCVRVANLACSLWMRVGGDDTSLFWFRIGALLHDVGKLMVPAEVLNKPGKLTDEEWEMVRGHPAAGVALLADIEFPWDVRPIVESHHERWDGRGYPHGLVGEAIPLTARVLGVADVYDALTSERSYKRAFSHDEAMEIMRRDVGAMFDPALFAEFERMLAEQRGTTESASPRLVLVR